MKVIICGAGQVGYNIARQLADEHNDVTVIDQSPDLIRRVNENLDVQGIVGHGSQPHVLDQAGAADAEMIIAVTLTDEVNMAACQVAHSIFGVPRKIARVRAQSYLDPKWQHLFSQDNLPIDVIISPEREVAHAIMERLEVPGAFDTVSFADGLVRVVGTKLTENCPVLETPLRQLTELFPDLNIIIVGIVHNGQLSVPTGDDQLYAGDEIYFASDVDHVDRAMKIFGHEEQEARRMILLGGGNVGLYLASALEEAHPSARVKLIEKDLDRATNVADQLKHTIVLQGDGLDEAILHEANVRETETVIALTNDDEVNILSSLLAKKAGAERAMTLITSSTYAPLQDALGIDVLIDPRAITVSKILQYVRRGRIRAVHSLRDGAAEIVEAEALESSPLVGKELNRADLPRGIMVGAIVRKEHVKGSDRDRSETRVIIPRGATKVQPGDRVILLARADLVNKVEQLFRVSLDFFG